MLSFDDFLGEEKFRWLPFKIKVASENRNIFFVDLQHSVFSSASLFLEGSKLNFTSQKKSSNESMSKRQYDSLTKLVWRSLMNWIFFLFWTRFLQARQAVKIQFKLGKKSIHQTWNLKLENVKIQAHIDRG